MISCIQPAALRPAVNRVAELAGVEQLALGYRDYRSAEQAV